MLARQPARLIHWPTVMSRRSAARVDDDEPGWASTTLDLSMRRAVSIPNLGGPVMMVVLLLTTTRSYLAVAAAGVFVVVCLVAVCSIVLSQLRLRWLFLCSGVAVALTWTVVPALDHVVTFANSWMTNFTSVNAALLLRGRTAAAVPAVVGTSSGLAIYVAHPDWDPLFAQGVFLTQVLIGIAVGVAMLYLRDFVAVADEEGRVLERSRRVVAAADAAGRAAAESSRTLHDTVVNTLGAIANGGRVIEQRELVRSRCARDIAAVEALLREHDARTGPLTATDFLAAVVAFGAAAGIDVRTSLDQEGSPPAWEQAVPSGVLVALRGAVHEAVLNAAKHSGVRSVSVGIRVTAQTLAMSVVDDGVGFDARAAAGFGLAESVVARCREHGIAVRIDSARQRGTAVGFEYRLPTTDLSMPALVAATQERACWAWAASILVIGAVLELSTRFGVLSFTWAMLGVVAGAVAVAWLGSRNRESLPLGVVSVLIVSTPAAFLLALAGVDFGHADPTMWQILGATVPPVLLRYYVRSPVPFLVATASLLATGIGTSIALWLSGSSTAAMVFVGTLCTLPSLAGLAHFHAALADIGVQALADERAVQATRRQLEMREAAELARARWQAAGLQSSVELLQRIANGDADPVDPAVRDECSREERYLRHLLMLSPDLLRMGRWLTHASARARERDIALAIRTGDVDAPDEAGARYLGELIQHQLDYATTGSAMTVGIYPHVDGGEMVVVGELTAVPFDTAVVPPPAHVTVRKSTFGAQFLVEANWREPM